LDTKNETSNTESDTKQWCTGSGFWSPIRQILGIFWIWIGLDIVFSSTGSGTGLSKWKKLRTQIKR